jgi:hypothetical protein
MNVRWRKPTSRFAILAAVLWALWVCWLSAIGLGLNDPGIWMTLPSGLLLVAITLVPIHKYRESLEVEMMRRASSEPGSPGYKEREKFGLEIDELLTNSARWLNIGLIVGAAVIAGGAVFGGMTDQRWRFGEASWLFSVVFTYLTLIISLPIVYGRRTGLLPFLPWWARHSTPSEDDEDELTTLGTIVPKDKTERR